ncbi:MULTISPECIES: patatin-like phospholipase family protein [Vibrio]|uniref:Patatin family protein n=1 Tax=Vibrio algicola TaxID=2662262 RepID=A0A5Q0TEB4_9VIBR|nr:patatin-like phospholipase family protein [Vibrio algicola]MBD1575460.1 patatin family protein [Vibrio sp. S11_S32]
MNNSGVVTDVDISVDHTILNKYANGRHALIAQGGGQKGIFTTGVLDSLLAAAIDPFDVFYGTSAGALNVASFLSRQSGLGKAFITDLTTRPEFFRLFSHIRNKQRLDLDWAFELLHTPQYLLDMDVARFSLGERQAYAAVTNVASLHDEYLPIMTTNWRDVLRATCAIPGLYRKEVQINGQCYVDGGVSASIPTQEAWRQGARMISVIRTEPVGLPIDMEEESHESFLNRVGLNNHFEAIQTRIVNRTAGWRKDFSGFLQQRIAKSLEIVTDKPKPLLNGGRWLFGGSDVYRLCHLMGDQFDSGLMDMLMVHHQTYSMTHNFMLNPPDDCYVLQIAPEQPLRSSSLLSKLDDLEFDYQLGIEAGKKYVELLLSLESKPDLIHSSAYIRDNKRWLDSE